MAHTITALEAELPTADMDALVTELLASNLQSIGLFSRGAHRIGDLPLGNQPAQYYERWVASAMRHLQERDVLTSERTLRHDVRPLPQLWSQWDKKVVPWAINRNRQARAALLRVCLEGLPGVLTGKRRAIDVVFPNSSMRLVEAVYRGNAPADYFNDVLCDTLRTAIERRLQAEPQCKIRIIEIGAGTGGTTAAVLPIVQRHAVAEYCYTDISKVFLSHAEKQFRPQCDVLTTSLFDVSKPPQSQSIPAHYDFAIASNVLHATANIRGTVRNAKAALRSGGVLLLNEISTWSLFNHLTFGLLEGWWLCDDEAIRLPGCPALSPPMWREILAAEGFEAIAFPAEEAHRFGQQVIVASAGGSRASDS